MSTPSNVTAPVTPLKHYAPAWQKMCDGTMRMETSTGWALLYVGNERTNALVFIPDPDKTWLLKKVVA